MFPMCFKTLLGGGGGHWEGAEGAGEGEMTAHVDWGRSATWDEGLSAPFQMLPKGPEESPGPRPPRPHRSASSCAQSEHDRGPPR